MKRPSLDGLMMALRGQPTPVQQPSPVHPEITQEMKDKGLTWALAMRPGPTVPRIGWIEVCDFCGGNCGQCGMTSRIGNVGFDFHRMVNNTTRGK